MKQLYFPSLPLMEGVVLTLSPEAPVTKWAFEERAVRFNFRRTRYRVGILSTGEYLVEQVNSGVLSCNEKTYKMHDKLKGIKIVGVN